MRGPMFPTAAPIALLIMGSLLCGSAAAAGGPDAAGLGAAARQLLSAAQPIWSQSQPYYSEAQAQAQAVAAVPYPRSRPRPGGGWGGGGGGWGGNGGGWGRHRRFLLESPAVVQQRRLGDRAHAAGRCVCAMDFDHTLRIERDGRQDVPAPDAAGIISDCKSRGYGIAIASANGNEDQIQPILTRLDPGTFNPQFFATRAFQTGQHDKADELREIADYYGTSPACIVLFDDSWFNKKYADKTGAAWRQVDGQKGVAWDDYKAGRANLEAQCGCQ